MTTAGNRGYVDVLAAAPHTLVPDRLSRAPREPIIDTFTGETVLGAGARTVRIASIGKTAHAEDTVVVYLPAEQASTRGTC